MEIFDSHFHIIDPRYELKANNGFLPDPFTLEEYRRIADHLSITKGTVVSASYQEFDQTYLIDALSNLGKGFYGVTQLPTDVSNKQIIELNDRRVKGLRYNIYNGMGPSITEIEKMANRIYNLVGWHVDLHINSEQLEEISEVIKHLPAVVVDHLGKTKKGFEQLLRLVDAGVRVKASGFGRVEFDIKEGLRRIHEVNPEALMFGTDLPSTRVSRPFQDDDVDLVIEALGEKEAEKVLFGNAEKWYGGM